MRVPFPMPEVVIYDIETGYALNIPIVYQVPVFWWEYEVAMYQRIKDARANAGIVVEDFPNGRPVLRDKDRVEVLTMDQMLEERNRASASS